MVACHAPLPFLRKGEVIVLNGQVNNAAKTLYADIADLCEVQVVGMAGQSYSSELRGMVTWQGQ